MDDLAIVIAIGIDFDLEHEQFIVTVQIVNTSQAQGGGEGAGGGASAGQAVFLVTEAGETVFDAVRNLAAHVTRKLYFPHARVLVLGREMAEHGTRQAIEFLLRDFEPRGNMRVLVADTKASEILQAQVPIEQIPANGLVRLNEVSAATGKVPGVQLYQFANRLISPSANPVAAMVRLHGEGDGKMVSLSGAAVFRDDKMVGELDLFLTRGYLWVVGEVAGGIIIVDSPEAEGRLSLEILQTRSQIRAQMVDGKPMAQIRVRVISNLSEQTSIADLSSPGMALEISKRQAEVVEVELRHAVAFAQEHQADIFGFGEAFNRRFHKEWLRMEDDWPAIFAKMPIDVEIESDAKPRGLTHRAPTRTPTSR